LLIDIELEESEEIDMTVKCEKSDQGKQQAWRQVSPSDGIQGGEISPTSTARGSEINGMSITRTEVGRSTANSTSVLVLSHSSHGNTPGKAGAMGLVQAGRQGLRRPHESHLAAVELQLG